jgi:hypothetical protein
MPSRTETILLKVFNGCIATACICVAVMAVCAKTMPGSFSTRFGIALMITMLSFAVTCALAVIPISIVRWWLAHNRNANVGPAPVLILAANALPVPADAFNEESVLYVSWSIDYKSSVKLNCRWLLFHRNVWIGSSVSALTVLGLSFLLYPSPPLPILVRLVAVLVGIAADLFARFSQVTSNLRKTFGPLTPIQSYGLVVNPDQIVFLVGDSRFNFPWKIIGRTWEATGIVLYQRNKEVGLIPDYAFRSRDDAKAFVATVNALKNGLPRPEYDWSAYVPTENTSSGVWPPPVA